MGGSSSTAFGSESDQSQIPVPQDPVPYPGPKGRYHLTQCLVDITPSWKFGGVDIKSNIDSYYGDLSQPYGQGFGLVSFYCVPYSMKRRFCSHTVTFPYCAIYFQSQQPNPYHEQWNLTIVKSQMHLEFVPGLLKSEVRGRTEGITDAIADMASKGGRLVCIENTQKIYSRTLKQTLRGQSGLQGVDVFFEMPLHPNPQAYTYTVANIPMKLSAGFQATYVDCDWNATLGQYLDAGWYLKEIYLDQGASHRAFSATAKINTVWFFEKPAALLEDNRPRYQGTIVFYELKSKMQGNALNAQTDNWGDLLSAMGAKGWKLACILDIPQVRTGFRQMYSTLLFFFQRELL